ncbi:TPA: hypothetical protein ACGO32_001557 [Streptococcus suis]
MKIIEIINSISLEKFSFDLERLKKEIESELEVQISISVDYVEKNSETNKFRAKVTLVFNIVKEIEYNIITISHIIEFSSNIDEIEIDNKNKQLSFALFEVTEPYIRHRINEFITQTQLSDFNLPYRFWETVSEDGE